MRTFNDPMVLSTYHTPKVPSGTDRIMILAELVEKDQFIHRVEREFRARALHAPCVDNGESPCVEKCVVLWYPLPWDHSRPPPPNHGYAIIIDDVERRGSSQPIPTAIEIRRDQLAIIHSWAFVTISGRIMGVELDPTRNGPMDSLLEFIRGYPRDHLIAQYGLAVQ